MVQWYTCSTRREGHTVLVIHVDGDWAIFLIFYNHQDTEYEWWETIIYVARPILTQKKIYQRLYGTVPSIRAKIGGNIVVIIDIYGARAISYYFVATKTLNLRNNKCTILTHTTTPMALWENYMNTPQDGSKILWKSFIFLELEPFFYYCIIAKTLNLSHNN